MDRIVVFLKFLLILFFLQCIFHTVRPDSLCIYPYGTETRQPILLDGIWNFRITNYSLDADYGFKNKWFMQSLDLVCKLLLFYKF